MLSIAIVLQQLPRKLFFMPVIEKILSLFYQDGWDPANYPKNPPRFASEFGFQTFPSFEILKTVSESFDWSIVSEFSGHR